MLREPRGYPAANVNLVLPSNHPEAQAGYVIMEQVEYPGMSGTNTMCTVTALLETGMLPMTEPVTELVLEAPAGLIRVRAECRDGKVTSVTFRNVPAFVAYLDAPVEVPQLGTVMVDVAYGGMFYVIASAEAFGLRLTPDEGTRHHAHLGDDQGRRPRAAAGRPSGAARLRRHHHRPALGAAARGDLLATQRGHGLDRRTRLGATCRPGPAPSTAHRAARAPAPPMAVLHAKGQLGIGEAFVHEGILGTTFTGRLVEETTVGSGDAARNGGRAGADRHGLDHRLRLVGP